VAVARRLDDEVLRSGGGADQPALGAIVFSDPEARRDLEGITHPAVQQLSQQRMREATEADPARVVVYDVPLLVEARGTGEFDRVVVVHAPRETRIERMVALRGMDEADAVRRIDAQATAEERLAGTDDVSEPDGTLDGTLA